MVYQNLVFYLEEESAKNMLEILVPKFIDTTQIQVKYICSKELEKITQDQYTKTSGSRLIAQYMDIQTNRSKSFQVLIKTLHNLVS